MTRLRGQTETSKPDLTKTMVITPDEDSKFGVGDGMLSNYNSILIRTSEESKEGSTDKNGTPSTLTPTTTTKTSEIDSKSQDKDMDTRPVSEEVDINSIEDDGGMKIDEVSGAIDSIANTMGRPAQREMIKEF